MASEGSGGGPPLKEEIVCIVPSMRYWSPWISPAMVGPDGIVSNTDAEQVPEKIIEESVDTLDGDDTELTEDLLM